MEYCVPENINPNKVFLVNYSELEGRLDPHFYQPMYLSLEKTLQSIRFKMSTLKKESFKIFSGMTPESGGDSYTTENGIYFLRSGDYNADNTIDFENVIQIKREVHNGLMKNSQLKNGDVLIAIVGATIGKIGVYTYDYEANINQAICAVRLKSINPLFVQYFYQTSIGQTLLNRIKRPVARANINLEEIGSLPIPVVDKEFEDKIIENINNAYSLRRKKIKTAADKLASIDSYLLKELQIALPKDDSYDLKDRMFTVGFKDVIGGRFDPKFYSKQVNDLKLSILKSPFDKRPLISFIENERPGDWGEDENNKKLDFSKYTKCLTLRATELDNRYNLKLDNSRAKYRYILNTTLKEMDIKPNDLLIEKSGGSEDQPVGRIAFLTEDILSGRNIAYSNFLHKITVKGINPQYLYYYLKLMHNIGLTDSMQSQTNGIRNLIMSEYKNQIIIVPDEQKQNKMVSVISQIRAEAKKLEMEGDDILKQAMADVEGLIFS